MGILRKHKSSDDSVRSCKNCEHAIFCESWGEYKCTRLSWRIKYPDCSSCDQFEKAKTDPLTKKCQCKVCSERGST